MKGIETFGQALKTSFELMFLEMGLNNSLVLSIF
jgi:hypothetical protein